MPTYPPAGATLSGDLLTISRFLTEPLEIIRQLRTLNQQRFIANRLLQGRFTTDSGAAVYGTSEGIYADADPSPVDTGSLYPTTTIGTGAASMANTVNWGNAFEVFDRTIRVLKWDPVRRGMLKLANTHGKKIDAVALAAINSAVTQNTATATSGGWNTQPFDLILTDVALAKAKLVQLNQGYMPDIVVVDDLHLAYAMIAAVKAGVMPREALDSNPALTGNFPRIDGMTWLSSPNVSSTTTALVLDSSMLGGFVDFHVGGEGWVSDTQDDTDLLEVKTIRLHERDGYKVEARRNTVPIVQEPAAAWKVTGI